MADRLVDLQDHLVGREQQVHRAARAVRRGEQLERLLGDARRGVAEAEAAEHLGAALPAERAGAERARLGVDAFVGDGAEAGIDEAEPLLDAPPARRDEQRVDLALDERCLPVDDPVVDAEQPRLLVEQFEPVVERQRVPVDLDRRAVHAGGVVGRRRGGDHRAGGDRGPVPGPFDGRRRPASLRSAVAA